MPVATSGCLYFPVAHTSDSDAAESPYQSSVSSGGGSSEISGISSPLNNNKHIVLDLHTSEAPIELTPSNVDLSIADLKLDDCAIDGILNVYVVKRECLSLEDSLLTELPQGKDEIFMQDDSSWAVLPLARSYVLYGPYCTGLFLYA